MKRKSKLAIAIAVLGATAVYAQDKYSLKSPSGIAFSDFRGYEDWSVVSSAPLRRGCARRLYSGFRDGKRQQEISEKRRMGIRTV